MRVVAVLLVSVLACGDKAEPKPSTSEPTSSGPATSPGSTPPKLEPERDRFGNVPGRVDDQQLAARKQRLSKTLLRLDKNGDQKVTVAELRDSPIEFLQFDDAGGVDRDGDGTISVEEIDAAIEDRRTQSRARWKTEIGR